MQIETIDKNQDSKKNTQKLEVQLQAIDKKLEELLEEGDKKLEGDTRLKEAKTRLREGEKQELILKNQLSALTKISLSAKETLNKRQSSKIVATAPIPLILAFVTVAVFICEKLLDDDAFDSLLPLVTTNEAFSAIEFGLVATFSVVSIVLSILTTTMKNETSPFLLEIEKYEKKYPALFKSNNSTKTDDKESRSGYVDIESHTHEKTV